MSKIEWTEKTWNPVTGCSKVSPGCKNCYAEFRAELLQKRGNPRYTNGFTPTLHRDKLDEVRRRKTPTMYFVNSMSDLFHEDVPDSFIRSVFETMQATPQHTYQVLTKRGERLAALGPHLPWSENVWMGVSVENDEEIGKSGLRPTDRIDQLRASGAHIKFISAEPLIGPLPELDLTDIDWVIVGGESGPLNKIRPMEEAWARDVVQQCRTAGVAVFVKQMGKVWAKANGCSHPKGGDMSKWPVDLRIREYPV